jgi:hypothetical protein
MKDTTTTSVLKARASEKIQTGTTKYQSRALSLD